jgi:hypothetical protein
MLAEFCDVAHGLLPAVTFRWIVGWLPSVEV